MPIVSRLVEYLDENGAIYAAIRHPKAYTAQEVAAQLHCKGKDMVKTVVVKAGRQSLLAVLPSTHRVDFDLLSKALQFEDVRLASEPEFQILFPECEPGAMPPFGNLYGLPVLCEESLTQDEVIHFNAGTHTDAMRMRFEDFRRLVKPRVARFATHL
jgi:Ala-tRNA(Pro) deacylase